MKRKFGFIFTFSFFDDTIIYKTLRFCCDLESAKSYATSWVEKYGEKYGRQTDTADTANSCCCVCWGIFPRVESLSIRFITSLAQGAVPCCLCNMDRVLAYCD